MNEQQLKQLLQKPDLPAAQRAILEAKLADTPAPAKPTPTPAYTADMDAEFLAAGKTYEAGKFNRRFERESPLAALSVDPVGKLWYTAWAIRLLGGWDQHAREHANMLLPVLKNSRSEEVLDLTFKALRSIHRNFQSNLGPELSAELGEALEAHVRKMDGAE